MTAYDQLPKEGPGAFKAFQCFLALGLGRSLPAVCRKLSFSVPYAKRLSGRFDWFARAREHDASLDRVAREAEESKLQQSAGVWAVRMQKTREEAYQMALQLMAKAQQMLDFPLATHTTEDGKTITRPAKWTFSDAVRMVEVAQRLKNLAIGIPTGHRELTGPESKALTAAASVVIYIPHNGRDDL